jgi:hypothetical protein
MSQTQEQIDAFERCDDGCRIVVPSVLFEQLVESHKETGRWIAAIEDFKQPYKAPEVQS